MTPTELNRSFSNAEVMS
uniref:Uncharacterized protein n=1 Tax=Anguilla anguilla TaxID=7936 RepID=A0A0E9RT26_ANGAN